MGCFRFSILVLFLFCFIYISFEFLTKSEVTFVGENSERIPIERVFNKEIKEKFGSTLEFLGLQNRCVFLQEYPFVKNCFRRISWFPPKIRYFIDLENPRLLVFLDDSVYLSDSQGRLVLAENKNFKDDFILVHVFDKSLVSRILPGILKLIHMIESSQKNVCSILLSANTTRINLCKDFSITFYYSDPGEYSELQSIFIKSILHKIDKLKEVKEVRINHDRSIVISLNT